MVSKLETLELQHLRAFVQTARRLSVTQAADILGRPKSAISKAIAELERRVGTRLLERTSRRVAVTPAGAALLAKAEAILEDIDHLAAGLREETTSIGGKVHVTAPPELGALLAETFIPDVLRKHPNLRMTMSLTYEFEDMFDPKTDIAFRAGQVHDERLVARPLGHFRRVLISSAALLNGRTLKSVDDLMSCNCLGFDLNEEDAVWSLERATERATPDQRQIDIRGNFAAKNFTAMLGAIGAGLGIAQVPEFLVGPHLARRKLVRVLPEWTSPPISVFLVHRFGHERIARVRAVLDAALAQVPTILRDRAQTR